MSDTQSSYQAWKRPDVLAVVMIAMSLLIIAPIVVLKVQEGEKLTICRNNIRGIGLAAHQYADVWGSLPPGCLGPDPDSKDTSRAPNIGTIVFLLPYLGESDLYAEFNLPTDNVGESQRNTDSASPTLSFPWWESPALQTATTTLAHSSLSFLRCPFDKPFDSTEGSVVALNVYGPAAPDDFLNATTLNFENTSWLRKVPETNYVGIAGCAGKDSKNPISGPGAPPNKTWGDYEGVFYNRSKTRLRDIPDGSGHTIMFGEVCGINSNGPSQKTFGFSWLSGPMPTFYGLPEVPGTGGNPLSLDCRHKQLHFVRADCSLMVFKREDKPTEYYIPERGKTIAIGEGRAWQMYSERWWLLQEMAGMRDGNSRTNEMNWSY